MQEVRFFIDNLISAFIIAPRCDRIFGGVMRVPLNFEILRALWVTDIIFCRDYWHQKRIKA